MKTHQSRSKQRQIKPGSRAYKALIRRCIKAVQFGAPIRNFGFRQSFVIAAFLSSLTLNAATYYVDYAAGSDSAAGTSSGTAWKHCPGDDAATGNADAASLSAADTVIFKGGVAYLLSVPGSGTAAIDVLWSGTAGNPITYDGNSAGTWGTGKAIITDSNGTAQLAAFKSESVARSNLVWRNFIFADIGGSAVCPTDEGSPVPPNPGYGIVLKQGPQNITVRDCEFYRIGYYWNTKPMDDDAIDGYGVIFWNGNGLTVTNCDFKQMCTGVYTKSENLVTNLTISTCRFSESMKWRVDMNVAGAYAYGGVLITNCDFFNCGEFGEGFWTGYGGWPHADGIFLRCDFNGAQYCTNADWTGINFCGNHFWDTNQVDANGTAVIYLAGGTSANIFNNVFNHTVKTRSVFIAGERGAPTTPQTARIYHNTFLMNHEKAIGVSQTKAMGLLDVRNNVFQDVSTAGDACTVNFEMANVATNLIVDYNLYNCANADGDYIVWAGVVTGDLVALQGQGQEAHGLADDPTFVNDSYATGWQCNLNDLRLQTNSPAIGAGAVLGGIFDRDKNGVSRGASVDLGAYEYATQSPGQITFGHARVTTLRITGP